MKEFDEIHRYCVKKNKSVCLLSDRIHVKVVLFQYTRRSALLRYWLLAAQPFFTVAQR